MMCHKLRAGLGGSVGECVWKVCVCVGGGWSATFFYVSLDPAIIVNVCTGCEHILSPP